MRDFLAGLAADLVLAAGLLGLMALGLALFAVGYAGEALGDR